MSSQNGQTKKKAPNSLTQGAVTLNLPPEVHQAYIRVIDAALKHGGCQVLNEVTLINHYLTASKTEKDEKAT